MQIIPNVYAMQYVSIFITTVHSAQSQIYKYININVSSKRSIRSCWAMHGPLCSLALLPFICCCCVYVTDRQTCSHLQLHVANTCSILLLLFLTSAQ